MMKLTVHRVVLTQYRLWPAPSPRYKTLLPPYPTAIAGYHWTGHTAEGES